MAITKLWIFPPLAIARVGGSSTPLENFQWSRNDYSAGGSGMTTLLPTTSLSVASDGTLSAYTPLRMQFKDDEGFRPACPFFELYGSWDQADGAQDGPITLDVLESQGHTLSDLHWDISLGNLKAFHMTQDVGTSVLANKTWSAVSFSPKVLWGRSPGRAKTKLIPKGSAIPLGIVQSIKPTELFPEVRIRFTPPKGLLYGPTDLAKRTSKLTLGHERMFLNPASSWCGWAPSDIDPRGTPGMQYAQDDDGNSLGLLDDISDGIVTCRLFKAGLILATASARVVASPPHYSPEHRPVVSIADGLCDRVYREDVSSIEYYDDLLETSAEVEDLLQRAYETVVSMNVDVCNDRVRSQENPRVAVALGLPEGTADSSFESPHKSSLQVLPLTAMARRMHRRLSVLSVFIDEIYQRPSLLSDVLRAPFPGHPFFDRRMPALMRGASGLPLTLTHRQYDLLLNWARRIIEPNGGDIDAVE